MITTNTIDPCKAAETAERSKAVAVCSGEVIGSYPATLTAATIAALSAELQAELEQRKPCWAVCGRLRKLLH
eukprot:3821157-Amphidinium_carterae.1